MLVLAGLSLACTRVRNIPLSELPKLSPYEHPTGGVVTANDGTRVRIDSFRRVEILVRRCEQLADCDTAVEHRFDKPRSMRLYPDRLEVVARGPGRLREERTHVVHIEAKQAWARVSERSASRAFSVLGVAAAAFTLVGASVAFVVHRRWPDADTESVLIAGFHSGGAAAGATLFVTLPATRPLGTAVE